MIILRGRYGRYVPAPILMALHAALYLLMTIVIWFGTVKMWHEAMGLWEHAAVVLMGIIGTPFLAFSFMFACLSVNDRRELQSRKL